MILTEKETEILTKAISMCAESAIGAILAVQLGQAPPQMKGHENEIIKNASEALDVLGSVAEKLEAERAFDHTDTTNMKSC